MSFKIRCFICDTPARALIRGMFINSYVNSMCFDYAFCRLNILCVCFSGVINHNGYSSCLKCVTEGTYSYVGGTMIFPDTKAQLRTDAEFRSGAYEGHYKSRTLIESIIGLDMIKDFPIGDVLHLIDLGITKKLLQLWKNGNNFKAKWSAGEVKQVSDFLIRTKLPREIKRPLRGLNEMAFWKGTEYRSFLLYASIVVVKEFFRPEDKIYEHFLNLYCAIVICTRHDQRAANYDVARRMLLDFLNGVKILYGLQMFTSNMHNLCHLVDDVERFGPLDTFSAYPFESKLFQLKRAVRTGNLPLSQVARRISEVQQNVSKSISVNVLKAPVFKKEILDFSNIDERLLSYLQKGNFKVYSFIQLEKFCINAKLDSDKWILTNDFKIMSVDYVIYDICSDTILLYGATLKSLDSFFTKPVDSSALQIYMTTGEQNCPQIVQFRECYCKMVKIGMFAGNEFVLMPLLHTLL